MWVLRPRSWTDTCWGLVYSGPSALHSSQPFALLLQGRWIMFCIMWFVIVFHVAQWLCTSRLEQQPSSLGVVEHHPGCLWCRSNCCMHVVIAYVWMVPIIVGYMVHLLAYAPAGCSRLFTCSGTCYWMHYLNWTSDIDCNIWFVFYRVVFWLSTDRLGFWDQTTYSGKLPSVTGEIVIKLSVIG